MSVSAGGVSFGKGHSPTPDAWSILAIASDPKKTAKRLAELTEATAKHLKAVEAHGKVEQIDGLLDEAKKTRAAARDAIGKAKEQAGDIIAAAENDAKKIVATAKAAIERDREAVKRSRERVLARERAATEREAAIKPDEDKARNLMTEAETMRDLARRVQASYESRIRRLKDALKEANL